MQDHGIVFRGVWVWTGPGVGVPTTLESLGAIAGDSTLTEQALGWERHIGASNDGANIVTTLEPHHRHHPRYHLQNHPEYHRQTHLGCHHEHHPRNPLYPLIERLCGVILGMMRRRYRSQLRDPKHVRDYFHKYALFTRIFHLCADGAWWLICRGCAKAFGGLNLCTRGMWPSRFPVNETRRRQHSFVVGRTGSGKSQLLLLHVRHYLTRNTRPTVVLLDPHGDLALTVARDRALLKSDRLV